MAGEMTAGDRALLQRLERAGRTVPFSERLGDPFELYQRGLIDISHARSTRGSMKITTAGRAALAQDRADDRRENRPCRLTPPPRASGHEPRGRRRPPRRHRRTPPVHPHDSLPMRPRPARPLPRADVLPVQRRGGRRAGGPAMTGHPRYCPVENEIPDPCPACGATVEGNDPVRGVCQARSMAGPPKPHIEVYVYDRFASEDRP